MRTLGFDVFGTLVDPGGIAAAVQAFAGDATGALVAEWRRSQLEFAFRRAAMQRHAPFDQVTAEALERAAAITGVTVPEPRRADLVAAWTRLPAYAEAAAALETLRSTGNRCLAFSNGTPAGLEALLQHAGLDTHLDDVLSVESVGVFKPAPAVYRFLVERGGLGPEATWLVSGNPWDVIGARAAGLRAAWIRRDPEAPFDPWGDGPTLVVSDLSELARRPELTQPD